MPIIFETKDFDVKTLEHPHHARSNGGHIIVSPKVRYSHRYEMPLGIASSLMHLTMVVGEASTSALRKNGLDIVRINYQDNGNWAYKPGATYEPHLHIHLYLRTSNEKHPDGDPRFQPFPDALFAPPYESGYYDNFDALTPKDITDIKSEIERLLNTDKYQLVSL